MTNITDQLASVAGGISLVKQFKISSWVNDRFEVGPSPREMAGPPRGMDLQHTPHWASNPDSGITGTVYKEKSHIFYNAPGWFNIGTLPSGLR
jgi:hypothetical protein